MIVYNSNLTYCFYNLDNKFGFLSLSLLNINARKVDSFAILILDRMLNVVRRLKVQRDKVFQGRQPREDLSRSNKQRASSYGFGKSQQLKNPKIRQSSSKLLLSTMLLSRHIVCTYIDVLGNLELRETKSSGAQAQRGSSQTMRREQVMEEDSSQ